MDTIPNGYRFCRPIHWENEDGYYEYSLGGTANIVRYCDNFFILTAHHCLEKNSEGWRIEDVRIPFHFRSEAYCIIGPGAKPFSEGEDSIFSDVSIHHLKGPSCPAEPLEFGEFIDIISFDVSSSCLLPRILSGYPKQLQLIDYDNKTIRSEALLIQGFDGGPTNDVECRYFKSDFLKDLDSNGFSGGLVTTNLLGTPQIQGICIQGGKNLDFIRFISVSVIKKLFHLALPELGKNLAR